MRKALKVLKTLLELIVRWLFPVLTKRLLSLNTLNNPYTLVLWNVNSTTPLDQGIKPP